MNGIKMMNKKQSSVNFEDLLLKSQRNNMADSAGYNRKVSYSNDGNEQQKHSSTPSSKKFRYQQNLWTYNPDEENPYQQSHSAKHQQQNQVGREGHGIHGKYFSPLSWFRRQPRLMMFMSYFLVFVIGITLGLIPFIKVYVDECKEDREILTTMIGYFKEQPWQQQQQILLGNKFDVDFKKEYSEGNKIMKLSCRRGEISLVTVSKGKVVGDRDSMRDVQGYCDEHETKISMVDADNGGGSTIGTTCSLSLQLVYSTDDTVYEDGFTEILYTCL